MIRTRHLSSVSFKFMGISTLGVGKQPQVSRTIPPDKVLVQKVMPAPPPLDLPGPQFLEAGTEVLGAKEHHR